MRRPFKIVLAVALITAAYCAVRATIAYQEDGQNIEDAKRAMGEPVASP